VVTSIILILINLNVDLAGIVPLWNAMLGRHANVVQALEYYGCTLKSCHLGKYAYIVASRGNMDLLQIIGQENDQFLSVPNFRGETALHAAVYLGDLPMIQYLVEMGVQIIRNDDYGHSPLSLAQIHGDEEIQNYLVERASLHEVVVQNNFPMVQYLVERGVPIDQNDVHGNSPYGLAQIHGGEEIRNYLEGKMEEKAMLFDQFF
jgi:hypothetical protein